MASPVLRRLAAGVALEPPLSSLLEALSPASELRGNLAPLLACMGELAWAPRHLEGRQPWAAIADVWFLTVLVNQAMYSSPERSAESLWTVLTAAERNRNVDPADLDAALALVGADDCQLMADAVAGIEAIFKAI